MKVQPLLSRILSPISFASVSGISVIVSKLMHVFSGLSTVFTVVALMGVLIAILLRGWKRILMYAFSAILFLLIIMEQRSMLSSISHRELVSDATEALVDVYYNYKDSCLWFDEENIFNDKIKCFLIPYGEFDSFCNVVFDDDIIYKEDPIKRERRRIHASLAFNNETVRTKYTMAIVYAPHLHRGRNYHGSVEIPSSAFLVLKGVIENDRQNWAKGRELMVHAKKEQNATASYYLSRWCLSGYGENPDPDGAKKLMREAAMSGSRSAMYEWGGEVMKDPSVAINDLYKSMAEDYLRKAFSLKNTVGNRKIANLSRDAFFLLNDYYRACGEESGNAKYYRRAYRLAKKNNRAFTDREVKYVALLDNCVSLGKYDEALGLIHEGEARRHPHCFVVHADLYTRGMALEKNYDEAEKLLRFAADSLDHYPAYRGLAELYRISCKEGADFWERLYRIKFSNRITEYEE